MSMDSLYPPEYAFAVGMGVRLFGTGVFTLMVRRSLRRAGLGATTSEEHDWAGILSFVVGYLMLMVVVSDVLEGPAGIAVSRLAGVVATLLPAGVVLAAAQVRARGLRTKAAAARKEARAELDAEAVFTQRAAVVLAAVMCTGFAAIGPLAVVVGIAGAVWVLRHPVLRPRMDGWLSNLMAGQELRSKHKLRMGAGVLHDGQLHTLAGPVGFVDTRLEPPHGQPVLVDNVVILAGLPKVEGPPTPPPAIESAHE